MNENKEPSNTPINDAFKSLINSIEKFLGAESNENKSANESLQVIGNIFGIIFVLFWNFIGLIVINLYYHKVTFLTDDFKIILVMLNISIFISIFTQASRLVAQSKTYSMAVELFNNFISLIILAATYLVFPFNFSDIEWKEDYSIEFLVRTALIVVSVGIIIGSVVQAIKLVWKSINNSNI